MKRILAYSCWFCFRVLCWCLILLALVLVFLNLAARAVLLFEDDIQDWASNSFGVAFSADIEEAVWYGIRPEFYVTKLSLGEPETALKVAEVEVEPDLLRSLLSLTPTWQNLQLDGVDMVLQEQENGGWQIAGIDLVSRGSNGQATVLEKMLLSSRRIQISDIRARVQFYSGTEIGMRLDHAEIENSLGFHRLVVDAALDDATNQLRAVVELTGVSNRFQDLDGMAYAKFDGSDLTEVLTKLIDRYSDSPVELERAPSVSGELWANVHSGSRAEFQGSIDVTDMPGQIFAEEFQDLNFHSDISGRFSYFDGQFSVDFVAPDLSAADKQWPLSDFRVSRRRGVIGSAYSLQLHSLDLEALTERLSSLYVLPEKVSSAISDLSPSGVVENVEVNLDSGAPVETLLVSADLKAVELGYYRDAPAVKNLSGRVVATATSGKVEVDAENLSMHFPTVYDWWLDLGRVTGSVGWSLSPEDTKLYVYGENLVADTSEGLAQGSFLVDSSTVPREEGMDFYLSLGFQNSRAEYWSKFVPVKAPESLRTWLSKADPAGVVPSGSVIYRGKVKRGYEAHRSIQLRLIAEQTKLSYLESWPAVSDVDGEIFISNTAVNIATTSASLPGVQIPTASAYLNVSRESPGLSLFAQGSGTTDSMLDLVRNTGLRDRVGSGLDQLVFEGNSEMSLQLDLPLKNELSAADVEIDLSVFVEGNGLTLPEQRLNFSDLNGYLFYDQDGIRSEDLGARLWQEPVQIELSEDKTQGIVSLVTDGELSIDSVRDWLGLDLLDNFSGKTQVDGLIQIPTDKASALSNKYLFSSDLVGIASTLPGELKKDAQEESRFELAVDDSAEDRLVKLDWSKGVLLELRSRKDNFETTQAELDQPGSEDLQPLDADSNGTESIGNSENQSNNGGFESAVLAINADLPEHQPGAFLATLRQDELQVDAWLKAILPEEANAEPNSGKLLGLEPDMVVFSQQLRFGDQSYGPVRGSVTSNDKGWLIAFEHEAASGDYLYPYAATSVPSLYLHELDLDLLTAIEANNSDADQDRELDQTQEQDQDLPQTGSEETDFDPRTLPAMDVNVVELRFKEASKGSWKAQLRPSQFGLSIENIQCQYQSLNCGEQGASSLFWAYDVDGEYSALTVDLSFDDVSDLFGLIGLESPLTSESGAFYASINWNAPPRQVLDTPLSGILGVDLANGEFLAQADSVGAGIMRLIGLVNIDTWLRRLQLDFSDVSSKGTAYDQLGGDFTINEGLVTTLTPVYVGLPSGRMLFDGAVDLNENQVDAQLVMTLPARQNMTWIAALAGGLPAAVGVWVVGQIFDETLDSLASVSYQVAGPLDALEVKTERIFDSTVQQ